MSYNRRITASYLLREVAVSIDKFGNISSVSIPLYIVNHYGTNHSEMPKRFLTCGYGVGLSWASVDFWLESDNIFPLVHTDECYEDGLEENY